MKNRVCMALISSLSAALLLCGCSKVSEAKAGGDNGKVRILYPGEETDEMANFIEKELNPKLKSEIGEEVEIVYKGWDQYWEQKDIMLSAGDDIDLYWDGLADIGIMVNKKQCQPLDELIEKYGQDLQKVIPQSQMDGGKVDGVQYGIPSAYAPSSAMFQLVCVRQDLMDEVGMKNIETPDDLTEYAEKVAKAHPELSGPADVIYKPLTRYFQDEQLTWCSAGESVVYGEDSKKAYSYFETDTFKKIAKYNRSMYEKELYRDELTTNYNERDTRIQQGTYIWVEGSVGKENEIISAVRTNAPDAVLKSYILAPEKKKYITSCGGEVLCVPYSASNPEGAVKFLNWFYGSEDNYMFAIYGPEGENYTIKGDKIELKDPAFGGYFYEWMFRNQNYQKFTTDVSDEFIDNYKNWDKDAVQSDVMAFHFDNSKVKNEQTAIGEVINTTMMPILCGYVDYDEAFPQAQKKLKDAGMDKYLEEVQRQLDDYLAAGK
ncbi:carbohydrate ABC transporter substrate-binding protein, CUT1 family [Lachnospiraceae bacterium KH1T2]|nr:carbohydrate ABC transporter substrate-binding protein, CUT1 family [Lachnospiraceae bacterium KH1T2]